MAVQTPLDCVMKLANSQALCRRNRPCVCVATAFSAVMVSIQALGCFAVGLAAVVGVPPGAAAVGGVDTAAAVVGCLLAC